jgi:hypothetical protein
MAGPGLLVGPPLASFGRPFFWAAIVRGRAGAAAVRTSTGQHSVRPEPRACESVEGERPQRGCSYFDKLNTNGLSVRPEPRACEAVEGERPRRGCSYFDKLNTNGFSVRPEPRACEAVEGGNGLDAVVHISTSSIRTVSPFALSLARARQSQGPALSLARARQSKGERPQPCCSYFDKLNTNGFSVRPEPRACEAVEG